MISKVDLHFRASQLDDHHSLGAVTVEHDGPRLAPHEEFSCWVGGRRLRGHITSIHQRGGHLPRIYADEVHEEELVH